MTWDTLVLIGMAILFVVGVAFITLVIWMVLSVFV